MTRSSIDDGVERREASVRAEYEALIHAYQTRVKDLEVSIHEHRQKDAALRDDMDALIGAYRELEASFFERHAEAIERIRQDISKLRSTEPLP